MKRLLALSFLVAVSLATNDSAAATTWVVTGNGEPGTIGSTECTSVACPTLRDAINSAASGDTIEFSSTLNNQTIALSLYSNDTTLGSTEFGPSALFITGSKALTIDATIVGAGHNITIARASGQPAFRLFDIDSGSNLILRGLTLSNGLAQGFGSGDGGGALGAGGAIFNQGILNVDQCTLTGNAAQGGSSGLVSSATGGGGVGADAASGSAKGGDPNGGEQGRSGGFGGGGGAYDQGGPGGFGGGGGDGGTGGAGGFGGGAGGNTGSGSATGGFGAGDNGSTRFGGGGAGMGGAIFNDAGTVTMINATLYQNSATGGNAGDADASDGGGLGGAIFNYAGTLSLSFVTLSANSVAAGSVSTSGSGITDGGAIYSYGDSNCGFNDGNLCSDGFANLRMVNSIAANSLGSRYDVVIDNSDGTAASSGGGNLIMNQSDFSGAVVSSANPQLGTLSPYPLAPRTLPISASSPAYDVATSCKQADGTTTVTVDERGVTRPQSTTCDIGAYEYDGDYIFAKGFE